MSNIDQKLREIAIAAGVESKNGQELLAMRVKQAFADEGYVYIPSLTKGIYNHSGRSFIKIGKEEVMTGQEWYDRWTKEFTELKRAYKYTDDVDYETINEAAKRTSGIEE